MHSKSWSPPIVLGKQSPWTVWSGHTGPIGNASSQIPQLRQECFGISHQYQHAPPWKNGLLQGSPPLHQYHSDHALHQGLQIPHQLYIRKHWVRANRALRGLDGPELLEVSELEETNLSSRGFMSGSPSLRAPWKRHFFMELKTSGSSISSESSRNFESSDSTCSTSM